MTNNRRVRERIYLSLDQLDAMEIDILNRRHVERYAMLRQWCYGKVIDIACGCGYGSYLIAKNPDVKNLIGFDIDEEAIAFANRSFQMDKLAFQSGRINEIEVKADVLTCIETIEHIQDPSEVNEMAERCGVSTIFVSYPSKKTTHYNPHHFHDFTDEDLIRIFKNFSLTDSIDLHREVRILRFEKKK